MTKPKIVSIPCRVCGRPVLQPKRAGAKKQTHSVCKDFEARLMQVRQLGSQLRFQDPEHLRRQRGDVMSINNGPLHHGSVKYAPDDPTDPPIVYGRDKTDSAHEIESDSATGAEAT